MDQTIIESFSISGLKIRTNNALEASTSGKIPALWGQFYASQTIPAEQVYGVYSDYESDASGDFTVTAGTKCAELAKSDISINAGSYLVFPANGPMPTAIIDTWKAVWEHFSHRQSYERSYETDFEEYSGQDSARIFIGIKTAN